MNNNIQQGFTLIELIISMSLASILLTLAIPSFQSLLSVNQLTTVTNDFVTAVNLARIEATRRAARVTLCKSADGSQCASGGSFAQGWLVFVDTDADATVDAGAEVIRTFPALPGGITAAASSAATPTPPYLSFVADGTARDLSGDFPVASGIKLCGNSAARIIAINAVGRVRVEAGDGACAT